MPKISELEKEYLERHPKSKQLYEKALRCFAGGVTHDARFAKPFPIFATKALRTRKWDVDGNEYIDYVMGHGTLLTGYGDKRIVSALQDQLSKAIHIGACTELEVEWAELIQKLVPCARGNYVRAMACGSEAVNMAIRLSRAYTNKDKVVLHAGSYHGKGDTVICATHGPPYGMSNVRGIPQTVRGDVIIVPYNNLAIIEKVFAAGEVSCIILQGNALYTREYIKGLRELAQQYGVVFILDEVVSGFRYAAGGAQEYYGVTPDLAILGKIVGGGAPIGAICGKKEIMELYTFKEDEYWNRFVRVAVGGTWNAQPICVAGGIAMMKIIDSERDTIYPRLYNIGKRLTKSFGEQVEDLGVTALAAGLPFENPTIFSIYFLKKPVPSEKMYLWQTGPTTLEDYETKSGFVVDGQARYANYLAMMNSGVNAFSGSQFVTCTEYTEEDLQKTEAAFGISLKILKENELI